MRYLPVPNLPVVLTELHWDAVSYMCPAASPVGVKVLGSRGEKRSQRKSWYLLDLDRPCDGVSFFSTYDMENIAFCNFRALF